MRSRVRERGKEVEKIKTYVYRFTENMPMQTSTFYPHKTV